MPGKFMVCNVRRTGQTVDQCASRFAQTPGAPMNAPASLRLYGRNRYDWRRRLCFIFPTIVSLRLNKFRDRNQPMTQERLHVSPPRFEHQVDALGIGVAHAAPLVDRRKRAAGLAPGRVRAGSLHACRRAGAESGRLHRQSRCSSPWPFAPLAARERLQVRVRVWGEDGEAFPWSELGAGGSRAADARRLDGALHHAGLGRGHQPRPARAAVAP
jgi:hypothetical protein